MYLCRIEGIADMEPVIYGKAVKSRSLALVLFRHPRLRFPLPIGPGFSRSGFVPGCNSSGHSLVYPFSNKEKTYSKHKTNQTEIQQRKVHDELVEGEQVLEGPQPLA